MEMESQNELIKPAQAYSAISTNEAVNLRLAANETFKPISIPGLLNQTVQNYGDTVALVSASEFDRDSQYITYKEYQDKVFHVSKAFIKLGLEARHSVGVLAFNCPEWFYVELAAIHAGGIIAGIYTTNSPDAVHHVLQNSKANIVVVDDANQMAKIRQIRSRLPLLKAAIQIKGPFEDYMKEEDGYYKWSDIECMDVNETEQELQNRLNDIGINECCCLIYTSGTVGLPKGVMLTHDNITFIVRANEERLSNMKIGSERIVSYLPLSHIAAQAGDLFLGILTAATIYFADKNALKGSLVKTLQKARPTFFGGVPRVFEKIEEKVTSSEIQMNFFQRTVINWARNVMLQHHMYVLEGNDSDSLKYRIARNLIGQKLKEALGLDQAKIIFSGAAPMSIEHKKFFLSLDIKIIDAYGLSESTGAHCLSSVHTATLESVGSPVKDTAVKILNPDSSGVGELCLKGRNIFMGYVGDEEKTKEALDDEGWLHTGDIAQIDSEGNVHITGRLKEIIITAGGENIPPVHIENLLKHELPFISNAFLVGNEKKYLTMLLTLKTQTDTESNAPLDVLQDQTIKYLDEKLGVKYTTLSEILDAGPCPKVLKCIQDGIERANLSAISNAQKVQKFAILPHDFSIPTGELGPTLKVKRNVVCKIYENIINDLYK